ncbi:potassium ABC transporter ATPase [Chromobacterium phragmitis]|uniref:Potassium ABC transporter ATPase n=2 Tax=Chromobacterium TaxID=535 RepID=A0AAX2M9V2_CHRVL|nr:potassium ABC transporter ATPase [Chromobacterium phragmitis]AXE33782.1 potassium ABC transporter ATPase [Chromobacterium phragmitis]STB71154.1 Uncharacterised protein [Chromobacterium violaceum]SUX33292.1 Uncharacterised protein [Chromobacterium violaceum]
MDLLCLGLAALFGALTWLLIAACDRLGEKR